MIDRSVPYVDILMHRKKGTPLPNFPLPPGFAFTFYHPGDEAAWAEIETAVLEFESEADALAYIKKEYVPFTGELERRCLFAVNAAGEKIATATAWWGYTGARRDPWLHWVAVKPAYQGLGLGKAITARVIQLMNEIEGDRDYYLHTQTCSYKAVDIYKQCGFFITDEKNLLHYTNENYQKAIEILENIPRNR